MGKHHSEEGGGGSAGFLKSPSSTNSSTNSSVSSIKSHLEYHNKMCQVLDTVWSEPSSPLIDNRSFFDSLNDPDQLFLLPDSVLAMDSFTFREDVNSIAPNFLSNSISSNSSTSSKLSPHHSLDSSETNRSLRLLEDIEGFRLARASDGCRTLWLCDATSDGSNVTPLPPQVESTSSSPAHPKTSSIPPPHPPPSSSTLDKTDQMQKSTESLSSKKGFSQRNQTSEAWFLFDDEDSEGRSECNREREDRVKRIREQQETDRRRKLEELKLHALSAQKFRQQQELERRRHIEELRLRDSDKRHQVEERKRALEEAERDRRVALLRKNKEREERIEQKRRAQNQMTYAFGSSTPRMIEPRVDSMSDLWGGTRSRSTSSSNVFAQMSQSMYCNRRSVERDSSTEARKQRATSAHGLDRNDVSHLGSFWNPSGNSNYKGKDRLSSCKSGSKVRASSETRDTFTHVQSQPSSPMQESSPLYWLIRDIDIGDSKSQTSGVSGSIPMRLPRTRSRHDCHFITGSTVPMGEDLMSQSFSGALATPTAHRRRTDLVPTLTASSRSTTPRSCKSPGLSRENTLHPSRPPSVMSTDSRSSVVSAGGVRMRNTPSRRPRPISIATTGVMSSSMYEKKNAPSPLAARNRQKSTSSLTGGDLRKKRARSVTSDREDDTKSNTSNSSSVMSKSMITRRTPAQVKADSAARKAKQSTSKSSTPTHTATHKKIGSKSPSLSGSIKSLDGSGCPDELKSPKNEVSEGQEPNATSNFTENAVGQSSSSSKEGSSPSDESTGAVSSTGKRIITSEEEAKARLAEKRREMKEKKEREAELERQRLAELERIENERLKKEEEEERLAMAEAEKLAEEARKVEEFRLQKAIEEAERKREEERKKQEEEEKLRKEREEQEKKKQEELSDKLRKEEEERMLRKKRIEEIMSRTRKPNNQNNNSSNNTNNNNDNNNVITNDPPSHDVKSSESTSNATTTTTTNSDGTPSSDYNNSEPHSSNKNGEQETSSPSPVKDINNVVETTNNQNHFSGGGGGGEKNEFTSNNTSLSADNMNNNNINENIQNHHLQENNDSNDNFVKEENAKNSSKTSTNTVSSSSSPAEKGVIHSFISENKEADIDKNGDISSHPDGDDNTMARITEDNNTRQDLDQIMELSVDPNNDITKFSPPTTTPIIAFEESINVPKQEPPTADLLS